MKCFATFLNPGNSKSSISENSALIEEINLFGRNCPINQSKPIYFRSQNVESIAVLRFAILSLSLSLYCLFWSRTARPSRGSSRELRKRSKWVFKITVECSSFTAYITEEASFEDEEEEEDHFWTDSSA